MWGQKVVDSRREGRALMQAGSSGEQCLQGARLTVTSFLITPWRPLLATACPSHSVLWTTAVGTWALSYSHFSSWKLALHRMVGVGRDLCGSSSPNPLPKQGHLQQAAPNLVPAGLEYLQRRRLHNLPGQQVPVLRHPQSDEVLSHAYMELPMLQFVPITPCPVTGHH